MEPKARTPIVCMGLVFLVMFPVIGGGVTSYDIIIVRGDMPTDYTVASIYASTKKIPLVLVDPDNIPALIRDELVGYRSSGYRMLLIIGGESAISRNVENDLIDMGFVVNRLWDWNRYGTAARVSIDLWGEAEKVVVTNGEDYGGFLVAQLAALDSGSPILFIKNNTVPMETIDAINKLGTRSVILISGESGAAVALTSLGVTVETIETVSSGNVENASETLDFQFYIILSFMLVMVMLLSLKFRKGGKVSMLIMTEDEEKIIEILKIHGKTEQSKMATLTDFSKPKISRMLINLEERGIIEREKYKKTYRIKLRHKIP